MSQYVMMMFCLFLHLQVHSVTVHFFLAHITPGWPFTPRPTMALSSRLKLWEQKGGAGAPLH